MIILGAGLAGCMAGALEREAVIYEASAPGTTHRAVLRFREDKIGRALGIPFRAVRVYKAIWEHGRALTTCSPQHANQYSRKVIGNYSARSILNLDTVTRFIAPDNLHELLAERCAPRINWSVPIESLTRGTLNGFDRDQQPILSTLPLPTLLTIVGTKVPDEFKFAPIHVQRWTVANCDVHQTIYFPEPTLSVYRATLTGDTLIVESMQKAPGHLERGTVCRAFGLNMQDVTFTEGTTQRFGKIQTLDSQRRKQLLLDLTVRFNVYSLGRFACWRNILLDDVYDDLFKIRSMIGLGHYDLMRSIT